MWGRRQTIAPRPRRSRGGSTSRANARVRSKTAISPDFDLLLVMDRSNYGELKRRAPKAAHGKIRYFLDYAPHVGTKDVPDPFFGGAEGFDHALDLIEEAAHGLVAALVGDEALPAKRGA